MFAFFPGRLLEHSVRSPGHGSAPDWRGREDRILERRYHAAVPLIAGAVALLLLNTAGSVGVALALWSVIVGWHLQLSWPILVVAQ